MWILIPAALLVMAAAANSKKMLTIAPTKKRTIRYIAVHITGTYPTASLSSIQEGWKARGWNNPGYHYLVDANGKVLHLQDEGKLSNGVEGYNTYTVNVSFIGGRIQGKSGDGHDTRTPAQKESLIKVLRELKERYPTAVIQGHRDFPGVAKSCPNFDAKTEYASI